MNKLNSYDRSIPYGIQRIYGDTFRVHLRFRPAHAAHIVNHTALAGIALDYCVTSNMKGQSWVHIMGLVNSTDAVRLRRRIQLAKAAVKREEADILESQAQVCDIQGCVNTVIDSQEELPF